MNTKREWVCRLGRETRASYVVCVDDLKPAQDVREVVGRGVGDALRVQSLWTHTRINKTHHTDTPVKYTES